MCFRCSYTVQCSMRTCVRVCVFRNSRCASVSMKRASNETKSNQIFALDTFKMSIHTRGSRQLNKSRTFFAFFLSHFWTTNRVINQIRTFVLFQSIEQLKIEPIIKSVVVFVFQFHFYVEKKTTKCNAQRESSQMPTNAKKKKTFAKIFLHISSISTFSWLKTTFRMYKYIVIEIRQHRRDISYFI